MLEDEEVGENAVTSPMMGKRRFTAWTASFRNCGLGLKLLGWSDTASAFDSIITTMTQII